MPRKAKPRKRAHGSITQRGQSWTIRWRQNGRRRSESYPDKDTAERTLARILGDIAAGRGGLEVVRPPAPPLSKLAEAWLTRREATHRSWRDDRSRWRVHLAPAFGHLLPDEVGVSDIRRHVEGMIAAGKAPATIKLTVALLGALFTDLVESEVVEQNPVRGLPRSLRRLMRPSGAFTAYLKRPEDVRALFLALEEPHASIFAIGALAGLRPGETLALTWTDIDLDARRITVSRQVRHGRVGVPKSGKPRTVPVTGELAKVLTSWRALTGGKGQLFTPACPERGGHPGKAATYVNLHTVHSALRKALKACSLPEALTLYGCTRHSFAAMHVLAGGSLAVLRELLGHSSVTMTEKYGALRGDMLTPAAMPAQSVDFSRPTGDVVSLADRRAGGGAGGLTVGSPAVDEGAQNGVSTALT